MAAKNAGHMNAGDGENSYARNSGLAKVVISKTLPVLNETLTEMFGSDIEGFPRSLKIVDLGCSSRPNTLFIISHILDKIEDICLNKNNIINNPEFEVHLNDLPANDFNNLFKLLPSIMSDGNKEKRQCFFNGSPDSFYCRLFPSNTLHFAYSSYSLHWLSQIPEGLENNVNKENICMARTSPPEVFEAYSKQFQRDFSTFLSMRSKEIVPNGCMVLTFIGRSAEDPSCEDNTANLSLLSKTLLDLVAEGLVKMDDLYSFNVPIYTPSPQEVETLVHNEGSFNLNKLQGFWVRWDARDNVVCDPEDTFFEKHKNGKLVANNVRAFMEPMLARHFGSSIIDELFGRYAGKMGEHLSTEKSSYFNTVISLCRR